MRRDLCDDAAGRLLLTAASAGASSLSGSVGVYLLSRPEVSSATVAASAGGHDPRHAIAIDDPNRGARDAVFIQEFSNHRPEIHGSIFH